LDSNLQFVRGTKVGDVASWTSFQRETFITTCSIEDLIVESGLWLGGVVAMTQKPSVSIFKLILSGILETN